ncbi:MAG: alpha/beta hydrolase [Gammaproteobacteria bacterium]|nr:alpha/beta hydrolase [Gammaproteobacteria bacterium]
MVDEFSLKIVSASEAPLIDIVFVHGLTGDPEESWSNGDASGFWPNWLQSDISNSNVYTLGYPSTLFEKWAAKEMDIFERANSTLNYLAASGFGARPIVFIAHSLGGLLTKVLIRKSIDSEDSDYKKIASSIKLCVFIATPHTGASLAKVLKLAVFRPATIHLLENETGFLNDLKNQYRIYADKRNDLDTVTYYETHKTKKLGFIVSRESADPGVSGNEPIAIEKDHIGICKPTDKDDPLYRSVVYRIEKVLDDARALESAKNITEPEYDQPSRTDRRELLQKLIDANKEHEYAYINDAQLQFAIRFKKVGLYNTAWKNHENLLSEIETRFVTHVYHPLICQNATDTRIRNALQSHVIDPVVSLEFDQVKFSPKQVLSALYFLTEQCHIRWDPEL